MLIPPSIVVAIHNILLDVRGTELDDEPKEYWLDLFALGTCIYLLIIGLRMFLPLPLVGLTTAA
jgi:hypothetical protein